MAVVGENEVFDFDGYFRRLSELDTTTEEWAKGTIAWLLRITSTFDGTKKKIGELINDMGAVNVSQKGAGDVLAGYSQKVVDNIAKLDQARQAQQNLTQAQTANRQLVTDLTTKLTALHQRFQALDPSQKGYAQQQRAILNEVKVVSKAIDAQNTTLRESKRAVDAAEDSYQHLSKQTNELRTTLRQMPGAFDLTTGAINKHNRAAMEMLDRIQKNDKALKSADAAMGQHQRNVGNYGQALGGLIGDLAGVTSVAGGLTLVFAGLKAGLNIIQDVERINAGLKAVSRDTADFARSQEFVLGLSNKLGIEYGALADSYKSLKAATKDTALEGRDSEKVFTAVATAGAKLNLSTETVTGTLLALQQMISKGHIQAEELRGQLGERLPGALRLMAEALGVSEEKLNKMMEQGQLIATDVLPAFADQLSKTYSLENGQRIETIAANTTRLKNETTLLVAAFNEDGKVTGFFNKILGGLSTALRAVREFNNNNDWKTWLSSWSMDDYLKKRKTGIRDEFGGMNAGMRKARLDMLQEKPAKDRTSADNDLIRDLRAQNLKLELQERQDAQRKVQASDKKYHEGRVANVVTQAKELSKKQRDVLIEGYKKEIADKEAYLKKDPNGKLALTYKRDVGYAKEFLAGVTDVNKELVKQDKKAAERDAKKAVADGKRAKSEADRALNERLSVKKADTGVQLSELNTQKQDGLISEQDFIDKRRDITLAGIADRQAMLTKAGKGETDDYKKLAKEKLDAETAYQRDSVKLKLSDSKQATTTALAGLSVEKSDGTISEKDYVEKRLATTLSGLNQQQQILRDAGQVESKLFRDLEADKLEATADYHRDRLKAEQKSWKDQIALTKEALKTIDADVGQSLSDQLHELETEYTKQKAVVEKAVAGGKVSKSEGDIKQYQLQMKFLEDSVRAVDAAYDADALRSKELLDKKTADLEAWKAESIKTPAEITSAEQEINELRKTVDEDLAKDKKERADKTAEYIQKQAEATGEKERSEASKTQEARALLWQKSFDLAQSVSDATFSIAQSRFEREKNAAEQQYQNDLKLAGDNTDAKTQIEEQYARRKAELQRKQAVAEREQALFNVALNVAQGVASVLSTGGGTAYADFGISAGLLTAFVIATGALQAAAILAAPLPAYKIGKRASDGYEGPAIAGEAGTELYVNNKGQAQLLSRPTLINTQRGDTIYTALETSQIAAQWRKEQISQQALREMTFNQQSVVNLQQGKVAEQVIIHTQAAAGQGSNWTAKAAKQAYLEAMREAPQHITQIDADGQHEYYRDKDNLIEYQNKRRVS